MKAETLYTPKLLNWLFGIIGLAIVWDSTHNWTAMLGAIVAGIHVTVRKRS